MIGPLERQASLFSFAFFKEITSLGDPLLDPIDARLDNSELTALCAQALGARSTHSTTVGRHGISPDRLLRCIVLKHLNSFSFRQLEAELRANLVYRRFTRFYEDPIPDHTILVRSFALVEPELLQKVHLSIVQQAQAAEIAPGQKLRTDTTAVETNIHHPTDSSLLADSLRVLHRSLQRVIENCRGNKLVIVNHARAAKYRVLEIARAAKNLNDAGRQQLRESYRKLIRLTGQLVRQTTLILQQLNTRQLSPLPGKLIQVLLEKACLQHYLPLVEKVIAQSRARIMNGDNHYPEKIISLFEPHSVVIRKGKAHKPNEFGRLVRIDEVEEGIVSNYEIAPGNTCDQLQWMPALEQHCAIFGHAPRLAAADRGFWNIDNEKRALALGVKHVVLPAKGSLSRTRAARQKERWFRQGQGWRAGIEPRISTLKHQFGMRRAYYKGENGFSRHVGCCIIAHNLVAMVRAEIRSRKPLP